jgi:AcrR family transcriptional regulator
MLAMTASFDNVDAVYIGNGNSVNMENEKESRRYHHGDLRSALIEAGLRLIEERDANDLSLREVARAVGVSATAVYRHFPDKAALLKALAEAGLERLAAAQRAASEAVGSGKAGFQATGRAYVRFALANPGLFRLTFANVAPGEAVPWTEKGDDATRLLRENAALAAGEGSEARLFALRSWALVHGLAVLMLDGQVPAEEAVIDAVVGGDEGGG